MAATRGRLLAFGALAAAFVTCASLGAAELVLRVVDYPPAKFSPWVRSERFGFRLAPALAMPMRSPEYDVLVETNSLGMRDDEPGPREGSRVLLLGDSFTMGYGVERGRIFADLLEEELGVDVVNAGTGGYEIVQQPRVLAEYGPDLDPDLVVYALYLGNDLAQNDEWEETPDGGLRNREREYPVRRPGEVKLWRLLKDTVYGARLSRGERGEEWLPMEGFLELCEKTPGEEALADLADSDRLLGDLAAQAARQGVPLVVVLLPYRSMVEPAATASLRAKVPDLEERYDLGLAAARIGERLTARGVPWLDATPFLVEEHRRTGEPLYFAVDGHFNARGHEAFARFLAPVLRTRLGGGPDL